MSGLPPIATELRTSPVVRFVPGSDICSAANLTLSAGELEGRLPLARPRQHDLKLGEKSGLRFDIYAAAVLLYDDVVAH